MLREIEDHMRALPSDVIEYADNELVYPLYISRCYNFGLKSTSLLQLSYTTFTIYNLVY